MTQASANAGQTDDSNPILLRHEPSVLRQPTPEFEVIADDLEFPEGPVALDDGSVLVVEIKGGKLKRITPDGAVNIVATPGGGPNGAAIGPDGGCYITNNGGHLWRDTSAGPAPAGLSPHYAGGKIQRVDIDTGVVEDLYTEHDNGPLTSPNDLVFDAFGGMWFTDLGKRMGRHQNIGSVCYAKIDGSFIREVIVPVVSPNGIGLSPSGDTLYVAETNTGRIWAFDIAAPGEIRKQRAPSPHGGRLVCNLGGYRLPDSMAVDADGNIHVGTLMDAGIAKVSPDGSILEHTPFPDLYTTNLCFGGPDLRTIYATLTQSGRLISFRSATPGLKLNYTR